VLICSSLKILKILKIYFLKINFLKIRHIFYRHFWNPPLCYHPNTIWTISAQIFPWSIFFVFIPFELSIIAVYEWLIDKKVTKNVILKENKFSKVIVSNISFLLVTVTFQSHEASNGSSFGKVSTDKASSIYDFQKPLIK
jgi:hypothetical protein